jgi:hypothetical protein
MTKLSAAPLNRFTPTVFSVFRIVFGLLYTAHGTSKVFGWPVNDGGAVPVGAWPYWWAGLLDITLGALILVGLSRAHQPSPKNSVTYRSHCPRPPRTFRCCKTEPSSKPCRVPKGIAIRARSQRH